MHAYTPWGCNCAVVIKSGQIHKAQAGFGHLKAKDYPYIRLGKEAKKELMLQRMPSLLSVIDHQGIAVSQLVPYSLGRVDCSTPSEQRLPHPEDHTT